MSEPNRSTLKLPSEQNKAAAKTPGTSAETVTVACKLPSGLVMRLFQSHDIDYPMFGGGYKTVSEWRQMEGAPTYELNGFSHHLEMAPEYAIAGGYALTPGIPKDFWEMWLEQNQSADFVKNNLIFAAGSENSARAQAKEQREVKSGLERLDPKNPPAQFRKGKDQVEAYDGKAA